MNININIDELSFEDLATYFLKDGTIYPFRVKKDLLHRGFYFVYLRKDLSPLNRKFKLDSKMIREWHIKSNGNLFDNISLDINKQIYFIKPRYEEYKKRCVESKKRYLENIREEEEKIDRILKKRMENKNKYFSELKNGNIKLDRKIYNNNILEDRISNYIDKIKRRFGYVYPRIEIEVYYPEDFKNFYYENYMWFIDFDKNVKELYDSYKKGYTTLEDLMEDLRDFGDSEEDYSYLDIYDLCKEVVKVLSRAHKRYSVLYYESPEIPKFPLVYLKRFEISEIAEVNLLDDINIISPFAFKFYSDSAICWKNIDKTFCSLQLNISKNSKLFDESKEYLQSLKSSSIFKKPEGFKRKDILFINIEK